MKELLTEMPEPGRLRFSKFLQVMVLFAGLTVGGGKCFSQAGAANPPHPYTVSGVVLRDDDSQPVSDAFVMIDAKGGSGTDATGVKTGIDGRFSIPNIASRQYRIVVEKPGFLGFSRVFQHAAIPGVAADAETGSIEVRLLAQAVVAGKITDANGDPMTNASVQVSRLDLLGATTTLTPVSQSTSSDLGEYRIFGLAPGRYYVSAFFQDHAAALGLRQRSEKDGQNVTEDYAVTYYPGSLDPRGATAVRLKSGAVASGIDIQIQMADSFAVQGSVSDLPPGNQTLRVALEPLREGGLGVRRGYILSGGNTHFIFRSVPPGEYIVRTQMQKGSEILDARQEVFVGSAPVGNVNLEFKPPFMATGTVSVNGNSRLPKDLVVKLDPVGGNLNREIKPEADGHFQGPLLQADRYRVSVSDPANTMYIKSVALDDQPVAAGEFRLDANRALNIELSDKAGRIDGVAMGDDQNPAHSGLVVMTSSNSRDSRSYTVTISPEGKFTLQALPPGSYRISGFSDLSAPADATWDVLQRVKTQGKEINVTEGDKQQVTLGVVQVDPN